MIFADFPGLTAAKSAQGIFSAIVDSSLQVGVAVPYDPNLGGTPTATLRWTDPYSVARVFSAGPDDPPTALHIRVKAGTSVTIEAFVSGGSVNYGVHVGVEQIV